MIFENAVKPLNIKPKGFTLSDTSNLNNPVEVAIKKFESQPSILTTTENIPIGYLFQSEHCQASAILREISELDLSKIITFKSIPFNRLKEMSVVCAPYLSKITNN